MNEDVLYEEGRRPGRGEGRVARAGVAAEESNLT
jgi:hypothetical protein